jgi:hypothetical protein
MNIVFILASVIAAVEPAKFTVKTEKADAPAALAEELRTTLDPQTVNILNGDGTSRVRFWIRKEIPMRATAEQVKNGLSYREIPEGSFLGVVQFEKPFTDFRKQELPAGTYSMRLAVQPDTGDHKDTAPHQDFCVLIPLESEKNLETLELKDLVKPSLKVTMSDHPAVLLMFPNYGKEEVPAITSKAGGVSLVQFRRAVIANEKPATLGFAFVVDGISPLR